MSTVVNHQATVAQTERGLSISGTRITLSDVMDYVSAGWPAHLIRDRLQLSEQQIKDVMEYIESNRPEVEREYQAVLRTAEENRRYWDERNRDRLGRVTPSVPKPDQAELRAKIQAWKVKQDQR